MYVCYLVTTRINYLIIHMYLYVYTYILNTYLPTYLITRYLHIIHLTTYYVLTYVPPTYIYLHNYYIPTYLLSSMRFKRDHINPWVFCRFPIYFNRRKCHFPKKLSKKWLFQDWV